jgi:SAM-dependent methyltransferase
VTPFFRSLLTLINGTHPRTRISHPQFLVNENLRLLVEKKFIGNCRLNESQNILDVGCGLKPYRYNLPKASWFGIDIYDGPEVDLVINGADNWKISDCEFDAVLCTEVLEHAINPALVIDEIWRVLKPGGVALITTPFIYGIHGEPNDFRRYTHLGLIRDCDGFVVMAAGLLGGIGSSTVININNWISSILSRRFSLQILLMPLFLIHCIVVNSAGRVFDNLDKTGGFGTNAWVLISKMQSVRQEDE